MSIQGLHGRKLRAQFPEASPNATVEGRYVPLESISVRSMNFGQHWRTPNIPIVRYSLTIPVAYFIAFLADPENLSDLIDDYKRHPDAEDPLDAAIRNADFPAASDVLNHPALAKELARFYGPDLLVHWLGDGHPKLEPGFVINSVNSFCFQSHHLLFEGEARPSGMTVQFQDV